MSRSRVTTTVLTPDEVQHIKDYVAERLGVFDWREEQGGAEVTIALRPLSDGRTQVSVYR